MNDDEKTALVEKEAWLHVYAQCMWHEPAAIKGNRAALAALRNTIDGVLSDGNSRSMDAFVSDGEGFALTVSLVSADELDDEPMPYIDEIANPARGSSGRRP